MPTPEFEWPEVADPSLDGDAEYAERAATEADLKRHDLDRLNADAREANLIWARANLNNGVDPVTELLEGYAYEESEVDSAAVHCAWLGLSHEEKVGRLTRQSEAASS